MGQEFLTLHKLARTVGLNFGFFWGFSVLNPGKKAGIQPGYVDPA